MKIKLFKQYTIYLPTPIGLTIILSTLVICLFLFSISIYSFLAINKTTQSSIAIIEGWVPDYCFESFLSYKEQYKRIYVTGGPLEQGSYLVNYKTFADLGKASLIKLGIAESLIIAVPAPAAERDRTFNSACALKSFLASSKDTVSSLTIFTLGVHARRSCILFSKAFAPSVSVGIISIQDKDYNPKHWYRSSYGFKTVITEIISYIYTKIDFLLTKPFSNYPAKINSYGPQRGKVGV